MEDVGYLRRLYKVELLVLKILPMLLALGYLLDDILRLFDIDLSWMPYVFEVSFISLIFIYISSWVFNFCFVHRMFIYYVALSKVCYILDTEFHLFSMWRECLMGIGLIGIILYIILIIYVKCNKKDAYKHNRRHRCWK